MNIPNPEPITGLSPKEVVFPYSNQESAVQRTGFVPSGTLEVICPVRWGCQGIMNTMSVWRMRA